MENRHEGRRDADFGILTPIPGTPLIQTENPGVAGSIPAPPTVPNSWSKKTLCLSPVPAPMNPGRRVGTPSLASSPLDPDRAVVVEAWSRLPPPIKGIVVDLA